MAGLTIEVYLYEGNQRPWFRNDGAAAAAFAKHIERPGWTLIPAHDLGAIMREAGDLLRAVTLEQMEEAHIVRVFIDPDDWGPAGG